MCVCVSMLRSLRHSFPSKESLMMIQGVSNQLDALRSIIWNFFFVGTYSMTTKKIFFFSAYSSLIGLVTSSTSFLFWEKWQFCDYFFPPNSSILSMSCILFLLHFINIILWEKNSKKNIIPLTTWWTRRLLGFGFCCWYNLAKCECVCVCHKWKLKPWWLMILPFKLTNAHVGTYITFI